MEENKCDYRQGSLPECAPLALAYVPMQPEDSPKYEAPLALNRGTLFPGLDLPFMNMVNSGNVQDTPLNELMALGFVVKELQLYLDTHMDDAEAFAALQSFINLQREGRARYVELYGPLTVYDLDVAESFTWLKDPWPWDYQGSMEE